jgi:hypothetical protein
VHLVETIAVGTAAIEELRSRYAGWTVSVEAAPGGRGGLEQVFLARKVAELRVSH